MGYPEVMPAFRNREKDDESPQDGSQNEKDQSKDLSKVDRVRTEFPETWLWSEVISGYLKILDSVAFYLCCMLHRATLHFVEPLYIL